MFEAAATAPYGGYEIAEGAYIRRSPFGQVDILFSVHAYVPQSEVHAIAFIPDGYKPSSPYTALSCLVIADGDTNSKQLECFAYSDGNIRVVSGLPEGYRWLRIWGSYFVL